MPATQISFASFAASLLASAQQELDFEVAYCTPPVQEAAVAVVAHPLAVDDGECSEWVGPVGTWWELRSAAQAIRSEGEPLSNGFFVLLSLANLRSSLNGSYSNSERVRDYDLLCSHAEWAIGAGC